MHGLNVLITFAGGLGAALVLGYVAKRLNISPIVGYLVAGIMVGPFTPGFVADHKVAEEFAEIGVILLLFGIGLRFHLHELIAVWRVALPGALVQSTASTLLMALLLRWVGWSWSSGIVLGAAISVASTVVMALVLGERRDLHGPIGYIAIGWTVVEDLLTVTLLLVLPILFGPAQAEAQGLWLPLGLAALKIVALVVAVVVLGKWVIPWALERIEKTRSRELFTLAVLVLAIGIAVGSASIFGVSVALGAFLAGLAVGRSEFAARAGADALPMRDAFAVLFFVSVGMLCNPRALIAAPVVTALVLAVILFGKPLAAALTVRLLGKPWDLAIPVGAAFSQVGEFSFILGVLARQLGLLSEAGWDALVIASILSIALNPVLYGWARKVSSRGGASVLPSTPEAQEVDPQRCVMVGYGPVGRTVHRILADWGATVTVVELSLETVRKLRAEEVSAVYGDALKPGILEEAGLASAGTLILTAELEDAVELVKAARGVNPKLRVLARTGHLRELPALRKAGATVVVGEAEVAVALAKASMLGNEAGLNAFAEQREDLLRRLYEEPLG